MGMAVLNGHVSHFFRFSASVYSAAIRRGAARLSRAHTLSIFSSALGTVYPLVLQREIEQVHDLGNIPTH